ncbi:hypothetical protein [Sphingobium sp.]|uniref:hypothetical protein n=1 Tax=Sphingobium sp. TaxID=1912891 RepID=UPI00262EA70E|nr:hypothetical protein [Sphingobium sp.]
MTDRYERCDAERWQEEPPAPGASDYDLTLDRALHRMEQRLSLVRMQGGASPRLPTSDRSPPNPSPQKWMSWTGGVGLLLCLAAMAWVMIATLPLLAARGEYFLQAGAAALARSLPTEPVQQRWPQ